MRNVLILAGIAVVAVAVAGVWYFQIRDTASYTRDAEGLEAATEDLLVAFTDDSGDALYDRIADEAKESCTRTRFDAALAASYSGSGGAWGRLSEERAREALSVSVTNAAFVGDAATADTRVRVGSQTGIDDRWTWSWERGGWRLLSGAGLLGGGCP